jgi:uncharacterized protein YgbK (DUF1537 family)
VEVSRGLIGRERVRSVSLDDIRAGGPDRVAEILDAVRGADVMVINALTYQDLETVALAALTVEDGGRSLLYRSGPSFVRALDGQDPQPPLGPAQIWPDGQPAGHGLIVVGSHVGLTSAQVSVLRQRADLSEVELDVPALLGLDGAARAAYVADLTGRVAAGLGHSDVLLLTSRSVAAAPDGATSLHRARQVSAAVSTVARGALAAGPAWVLAKGGITSHDVAVTGLGIRRAEVVGQFFDGMVSLYRPAVADARAVGRPFVVFAGNVGDQAALAEVATRLATPAMEGG